MTRYKRTPGDCGMAEKQFRLLEILLELRDTNQPRIVTEQNLIDRLYNDRLNGNLHNLWSFFKTPDGKTASTELAEDIKNLHQRGYLFEDDKGTISPTRRAELIYIQVYGEFPPIN